MSHYYSQTSENIYTVFSPLHNLISTHKSSFEAAQKAAELDNDSYKKSVLIAFEAGYRACERGENTADAVRKYFDLLS